MVRYRCAMSHADRPELLILYASIGSGHEMAAAAIAEQVRALAGTAVDVRQLDLMELARIPRKRRLSAVPSMPGIGAVYDAVWGAQALGEAVAGLVRLAAPALLPHVAEQITPTTRVVVSTHALGAVLTAKMPKASHVSVLTDLMPHAFWPRQAALTCVPTTEARAALIARGFAPEQIAVTGIPVRLQFAHLPPSVQAKASLGLSGERPVALVAAGADDPGPYAQVAHRLSGILSALLGVGLMPLVLTGTDAALLEHVTAEFGPRVLALPFSEDVATPMAAADVVVAKPGGLLIAECLACGKPLALLARGSGQERANSEYLAAHNAAFIAETDAELADKLASAMAGSFRPMAERAAALGLPDAARDIATRAIALMEA
jgi:processive 1,2-diacylglycerol beta-glucosyltransferase